MEKYKIKLAKLNGTVARLYPALVTERIRTRYSLDAELAILRQRDDKPEEFAEYHAYAEACKREARAELELEEGGEKNGMVDTN